MKLSLCETWIISCKAFSDFFSSLFLIFLLLLGGKLSLIASIEKDQAGLLFFHLPYIPEGAWLSFWQTQSAQSLFIQGPNWVEREGAPDENIQ